MQEGTTRVVILAFTARSLRVSCNGKDLERFGDSRRSGHLLVCKR
jgi:hypothetical protein